MEKNTSYPFGNDDYFVEVAQKPATDSNKPSFSVKSERNISKIEICIPDKSNSISFDKKRLSLISVPADLSIEVIKCFLQQGS